MPDWESIALDDREVFLCFDSDVMTRIQVYRALERLKAFLEHRGGNVRVVYLPEGSSGAKVGVDDFIAGGGNVDELALKAKKELKPPKENDVKKKAIADRALGYVLNEAVDLFHDQHGQAFIAFAGESALREVWPVASNAAREFVRWCFYEEEAKAISGEGVSTVLGTLSSAARFKGPKRNLSLRVAEHEGVYWYDLSDWRAVEIDTRGWSVVDQPPILFRRFSHQSPQVEPVHGDIQALFELVNVSDSRARLLLAVYLVAALIPEIPLPILVVYGEQGSAKSFLLKLLKRLIDPSVLEVLTFPESYREFAQLASHHRCVYLDNLNSLSQWLSDALCRLCSGDGFSKRQLHTDDEDVIYRIRGLGGINGINNVAVRSDLLDRSLLIQMDPIDDSRRLPEKVLWKRFEELRPGILGSMFSLLSKAISIKVRVELSHLPRLADFAEWGTAISIAMGYDPEVFTKAYCLNVESQTDSAIDESLVAQAVIELMDTRSSWAGTPTQFLGELNTIAEGMGISLKDKMWPKGANRLRNRLNEASPNLRKRGIHVGGSRSGKNRMIRITRETPDRTVTTVTSVTDRMNKGEIAAKVPSPGEGTSSNGNAGSSPGEGTSSNGNAGSSPDERGGTGVNEKSDGCDGPFDNFSGCDDADEPWESFLNKDGGNE